MKYLLLLSCLLTTSHLFAMTGKVPSHWTSSEVEEQSFMKSTNSAQMAQLSSAYQNILDAKAGLFEGAETVSGSRWFLQSIKTEMAVEAEGTLGVLGVGGEAALELVWIKKPANPTALMTEVAPRLEEETTEDAEEIQVSTSMSEEALKKEIAPVVDLAMATGHVKKRQGLLNNLLGHALKFQETARELESSPVMGPWYVYKYQLELYVSAEGKIALFKIGNAVRLRLEWYRLQKEGVAPVQPPMMNHELSANAKFVASVASDVATLDQVPFNNDFRLNCMKIGVGTTVKGNLFFVKSKARAVGSLFFKRDVQEAPEIVPQLMTEVSDYTMADKDSIVEIPRWSFRKGLQKAAAISRFFASNAKIKGEGQFELSVIETEFELYGSGGLGLVTVEGAAGVTLFVTRNVTI